MTSKQSSQIHGRAFCGNYWLWQANIRRIYVKKDVHPHRQPSKKVTPTSPFSLIELTKTLMKREGGAMREPPDRREEFPAVSVAESPFHISSFWQLLHNGVVVRDSHRSRRRTPGVVLVLLFGRHPCQRRVRCAGHRVKRPALNNGTD